MRDNPRYSIIPAGAVVDPRLKGWDLRVLCLLGCHTDKLGWCDGSSQEELADAINCGRSTFQRSINRLVESGWVQTRAACVSHSGRSYASYAYRVVMDRDDIGAVVNEHEVAAPTSNDDAHGRAPCPRAGTLPKHAWATLPTYAWAQEADQVRDLVGVGGVARAREPLVSEEATALAWQIAAIAGLTDIQNLPPGWCGAPMRVDAFLREGYHPEVLLIGARAVMATRKSRDPPWSIEYFASAFAKARGLQLKPLPIVEVQSGEKVVIHEQTKSGGIVAAGERKIAQLERSLADIRAARTANSEGAVCVSAGDDDVQMLEPRRGG